MFHKCCTGDMLSVMGTAYFKRPFNRGQMAYHNVHRNVSFPNSYLNQVCQVQIGSLFFFCTLYVITLDDSLFH